MRLKFLMAAILAVLVAGLAAPGVASASSCFTGSTCNATQPVSAALTGTLGTRVIAQAAVPAMTSAYGSTTETAAYSVTVAETAASGDNWNVSGELTDITGATPAGFLTGTTSGSNHLPGSALNVANTSASVTPSGPTDSNGAGGALGVGPSTPHSVTMFTTVEGSNTYTDLHTGSGSITLTPPNGQAQDTYTGYFTVTLNE